MNKKTKNPSFKKSYWNSKLFTVNNFKYATDDYRFLLNIGPDVWKFANDELGYDITKPKQLESFFRKCFRAYWYSKNK